MGAVNCNETNCRGKESFGCAGNSTEVDGRPGFSIKCPDHTIPLSKMASISSLEAITYKNGGRYQGELTDNNARDGFGRLTLAEGTQVVGDWTANKLNGVAKIVTSSGDIIEGRWTDGLMDREHAKFINGDAVPWNGFDFGGKSRAFGLDFVEDGPVYIGQIKGINRNGMGFLIHNDGSVYKVAIN